MRRTKQRQNHERTRLEVYAKGESTGEKWEIEDSQWRGKTKMEGAWGVREGEQGGGCGIASWLLLIFCKPQSASAISIHFLHPFLPFSSTLTHRASSKTLLPHPPSSLHSHSSLLYLFPYLLASLYPISLLLYLTASTFPCHLYSHHISLAFFLLTTSSFHMSK